MSERLRTSIRASGYSRYRLAKETGVSQSALSRFVAEQSGLSLESVDALAVFLGLELVEAGSGGGPTAGGARRRKAVRR